MSEVHDDIIRGEIPDLKNVDSWIRLNKYCCRKVKEYICSLHPIELDEFAILRDMDCNNLRILLETTQSNSPQETLKNPELHVSTMLSIWDECMASANPDWIEEMS
tara:strand:+ start:918 stop:1235 length:318 start_codon:yes stop_codon:yes gene_type:complete